MRDFSAERLEGLYRSREGKPTFWRHDVDYSLAAAMEMASTELDLGVRSTYYVMIDSPFYSAAEGICFASYASTLGHGVGWHADPRAHDPNRLDASRLPYPKVSWHCPRLQELWRAYEGFHTAYHPRWEGRYYSDSRGRFAFGDPEDDARGGVIQVNLHPEWWFAPSWHHLVTDDEYEAFFHEGKAHLTQP